MERAGLIYDDSTHYLDHLAPFCASLNWPLIVCEASLGDLARTYYPDLQVIEIPYFDLKLPTLTLTCDTQPLLQAAFPHQTTETLWLPHGNSDKGTYSPLFEALKGEKRALVYGQRMIDFMREKNVSPTPIPIGNFRLAYYEKYKSFYQKLLLLPSGKNFLYAPTWDDMENSNSFWRAFPQLADRLPSDCNLFVKLHPNTLKKYEPEIEVFKGRYAKKKNLLFLPEYPPIYPLLSQCSAYIGDMSSIGYDFLFFNRPLYFLNSNQSLPLHKCGKAIDPKTFDFSLEDTHSVERKALYSYTFSPLPTRQLIQEQIDALCRL